MAVAWCQSSNFKLPSFRKRHDSSVRGLISVKRPPGGTAEHLMISSPMALPVLGGAQEVRQKLTSSCVISKPKSHEIFLSHAGKQKSFVRKLYNDFLREIPRIYPFFDQDSSSLPLGEEFPDRIFKAARECVVAVVILTKEYVTSKWPMLELLTFVEAQKSNRRLKLLPVFFDDLPTSKLDDHVVVDESWVAAWTNMSSGAHREITITVELCKEALRKLRKINGLVLTNTMPKKSLRRKIVKAARDFLTVSPDFDIENMQGCRRLCETISDMFLKNRRGVYCLGLYGMRGLGKTTMCKALCSYFSRLFKVCHLDIGSDDKEMKFKRYIKILRSLSDVPNDEIDELEKFDTDYKVEKYVQQCLSDKQPKFLAVDNVHGPLGSCKEARNYLNWLSEGSIIVITSRSRDNVLSVTGNRDFCKPIPVLEEEEAMTLFLKIAAPEVEWTTLRPQQIKTLRECLQVCYFPSAIEVNHEQVGIKVDDRTVNGESGHYHPLALRAVASYLNDLSPGQENPFLHWEEVLKDNIKLFHARRSIDKVLVIGFKDLCDLSKQLFIDVALYAPQPVGAEDIFDWLVSIHQCKPQTVKEKLKELRRKCFLNYDDCKSPQERCKNISMHELYRDFAEAYLGKENEGLSTFGVYDGGDQHPPSLEDPGWAKVRRMYLQSLVNSDLAKVKEWRNVAVVHLVGCGEITTFSIGELVSLLELVISKCSKLELLSWTQDIETEGDRGGKRRGGKLRFVSLSDNKSLRTLPNFSDCSELRSFYVTECSSSVEPLQFHNCSRLQVLHLEGNDVPEVQSLQSCPELRSVRLRWKAMHKGLPLLDELPCLSELEIKGASDLPLGHLIGFSSRLGRELFFKRLPKDSVCHDLPWIRGLKKLERVVLNCIPLGTLLAELAAVGSSLQSLNLSGCLLSPVVDFSAFPNLRSLQIRWTNVKEIYGLERLTKLRYLGCDYCFELQKVPDLRPLSELQGLQFLQCSKLLSIPRLPPQLFVDVLDSEDIVRATIATLAFAKTVSLPHRRFAIGKRPSGNLSQDVESAIHSTFTCDGCMMFPLRGPRYNARPVRTAYDLCSNCFSERCRSNRCSDTEKTKPRWVAKGVWKADFDLCSSCYKNSNCNSNDFYKIDQTPLPKCVSNSQAGSVSGLSTSYQNKPPVQRTWGCMHLRVYSFPFRMPEALILDVWASVSDRDSVQWIPKDFYQNHVNVNVVKMVVFRMPYMALEKK